MIAVLDNIRSSHNVGSIFRTADAAGIEQLCLCGITPAPRDRFGLKNTQLAKVALGAELTVPWTQAAEAGYAVDSLQKEGYAIVVLEQAANAVSIFDDKLKILPNKKIALILGAEVTGVAPAVMRRADYIAEIPMYGTKESLNVAVAFGIAVYALIISSKIPTKRRSLSSY